MTAVLPLTKSVLALLAKCVLIPLPAGLSAADAASQKNIYGSGRRSDLSLPTTTQQH